MQSVCSCVRYWLAAVAIAVTVVVVVVVAAIVFADVVPPLASAVTVPLCPRYPAPRRSKIEKKKIQYIHMKR